MKTGKIDRLEYRLMRSNRKSVGISVERDGTIMVTAPHKAELIDIKKFVSEKRIWIYQKLAQKKALNREGPKREFVNGQGFLYLGKSYRLKLINGTGIKSGRSSKTAPLRLWHGYF